MSNPVNSYNYDISQIFLEQPFILNKVWTNTSGADVTVLPGRLFGEILATSLVLPHISTATDGSEQPFGILAGISPMTVANGASATIPLAIKGNINKNKLILSAGETLSTVVRTTASGGGTIGALITKNTGIIVVATNNVSGYDNAVS